MITQDEIRRVAIKNQTTELNVIREYLQHLFLSYFYGRPQTKNIYFKGGTALKIVYLSARFSEDLDFSTNKGDVQEIEACLIGVLEKIEKENIQATLKEAKTTTGGYLSAIDFMIFGQRIPIQIEISFREKGVSGQLVVATPDFMLAYTIVLLKEEQLISGKVRALIARQKPRDFYDLYFILRKRLPITDKKTILPQALIALNSHNIDFDVELKQFLPRSHWPILKDFKTTLEREIKRYV